MDESSAFADILREYIDQAGYTIGQLAKRAKLPKTTIVNWVSGFARQPREWRDLVRLAAALNLGEQEATRLLLASGFPSVAALRLQVEEKQDRQLLARWASTGRRSSDVSLPLDKLPIPMPLPVGSRMPLHCNPLFIGRENDLWSIANTLLDMSPTPACTVLAITGLGGIGKTQIASEFVHRFGQYFEGGVFWVSFADASNVAANIAACGSIGYLHLHPNYGKLSLENQVELVLSAWQRAIPRLLIFDNCDDEALFQHWRPRTGGCRIIITSRRANWGYSLGIRLLPLAVLARSESIALLRKFQPEIAENDPDLNDLAAELGDLPLTLHLAGHYLARFESRMTPHTYLTQLRQTTLLRHRSMQSTQTSPTNHIEHVERTFTLSYERLDGHDVQDRLALAVLERAAFFAPGELIPLDTLHASCPGSPSVEDFGIALERLSALGLVEIITRPQQSMVRMHRLLILFVRHVNSDTIAQTDVELVLLSTLQKLNESSGYAELLSLQTHLRAVADLAISREDERSAELCYELSLYLAAIEDYTGAHQYNQHSITIRSLVFGSHHPVLISNFNHAGWTLHVQWQYPQAQKYHEQALHIAEQAFASDHALTADTLNYLGAILHAQDKYQTAQDYYVRALEMRQRLYGDLHNDTAQSLNNYGLLLHATGRYSEALRYHRRAFAIREQVLEPMNTKLAFSLNNLGYTLRAIGDYTEGLIHLERALAIREHTLGSMNSYVAATLNHIGRLLHYQGNYTRARPYLERALMIYENTFGPHQAATAHSLSSLGMLAFDEGGFDQANALLERAVTYHERIFGSHNRNTARSQNHLGLLRHAQGQLDVAQTLFEQALQTRLELIGSEHPDTLNAQGNLGMLLIDLGDLSRAQRYIHQALVGHQRVLGNSHPYTLRSRTRFAILQHKLGYHSEALLLFQEALKQYQQTLGDSHPFTQKYHQLYAEYKGEMV